jgi:UDP-N-acetylglucosamine acyltransferase
MIGCHIGGGAMVGSHGILINNTRIGAGAVIEDNVHTSGFVSIKPGVRVGAYTFTLGYSEIGCDAPPYAMVQGMPFRVRGANTEKLRRCRFSDSSIKAIQRAFTDLYNGSGESVNLDVLNRLLTQPDVDVHVQRLVQSIKNSSQ